MPPSHPDIHTAKGSLAEGGSGPGRRSAGARLSLETPGGGDPDLSVVAGGVVHWRARPAADHPPQQHCAGVNAPAESGGVGGIAPSPSVAIPV